MTQITLPGSRGNPPFFVSEFTPLYNIGGGGVTEKRGVTLSSLFTQVTRIPIPNLQHYLNHSPLPFPEPRSFRINELKDGTINPIVNETPIEIGYLSICPMEKRGFAIYLFQRSEVWNAQRPAAWVQRDGTESAARS